MSRFLDNLSETQAIGSDTTEYIVPSSACSTLADNSIFSVGISYARAGFEFVRVKPEIAVVLMTLEGYGLVLLDDSWHALRPGEAYLAPPLAFHSYRAPARGVWHLCWVAFNREAPPLDFQSNDRPSVVQVGMNPLYHLISALYQEYAGMHNRIAMKQLGELINHYARRLYSDSLPENSFRRLLGIISNDLARPWKVQDLAEQMGMSNENLRLLCHKHLGRSLGKHITLLRMQRATHLLTYTDWTIETIAYAVGYSDPFAFSTAFRRSVGLPPSEYRTRQLTTTTGGSVYE